jgi:UDP-N-acetylmuramoylalanine--D-glutamate ligase
MLRGRADSPISVAVFTNVLTDHLERHGTREDYARAKLRLLEVLRPGGAALLPGALPVAAHPSSDLRLLTHPGGDLSNSAEGLDLDGERLATLEDCAHLVAFQRDNLHLALAAARLMGAPADALSSAAREVRGLPHRLDLVGELRGRRLWDNAVSTTPDSTISALEALPRAATVMLGGKVKDIDLQPLLDAAHARGARVVLFGAACEPWGPRFRARGLELREASGPREALAVALDLGEGDLLFSPACSSFDAYSNFKARADDLLDAARELGLTSRAEIRP